MKRALQIRRTIAVVVIVMLVLVLLFINADMWQPARPASQSSASNEVVDALNTLEVKGRAPKTGYTREQFGKGWLETGGCDTRNKILYRDLVDAKVNDTCKVVSGTLHDPYTGKDIIFTRGASTSDAIQIDHVVALGDAWQKGAQQLTAAEREQLANDPLELLAVDGKANQQKSDSDAASWLPPNKPFRCQYVARQVAVKKKYKLWVTQAEKDAIINVISSCPAQTLPRPTV
ncbi:MAG TPA: HNH endonuclease family protein [Candidatus Saccharimonadales bacterium]